MRQLVELRLLQTVGGIGEIGAAILLVAIEEQIVEPARQIVMMRDVPLRSALHVDAVETVLHRPRCAGEPARIEIVLPGFPLVVGGQQVDEVADIALLDDQPAVHEALARAQRRVARDRHRHALVGEADRHLGIARLRRAERGRLRAGAQEGQAAALHRARKKHINEGHGGRLGSKLDQDNAAIARRSALAIDVIPFPRGSPRPR